MSADSEPDSAGDAWARAVVELGGSPTVAALGGRELDGCYAQPHRRYHVGAHVTAVLRDALDLACDEPADALVELALAACAHDVVYDAAPGADEALSAEWAHAHLSAAGVPVASTERVVQLVLTTATHEAPDDDLAADALLDADLAILAAVPAGYDRYVRAVRFEYRSVSEPDWRRGRAAVLRHFAERPAVYALPRARARWEAAARANIARELATLA